MNSSDSDWQSSCSTIQHANLYLLKSGKFSDVVFLVGETKIPVHAHKFILTSRSSVFETMFERWETEKECQIEIPEVTHMSFQLFLVYLYSNAFAVKEEDSAVEILYLAHKYSCSDDLTILCSNYLSSALRIGNVIQIHQIASRLDQVTLCTQTMEFILRNGKSVFQDDEFLEIDSETLTTVLKDDNLVVDELTIFRAVMRWAENKCKVQEQENTAKNKRSILKNLLYLIRFPLMRTEDFTDEVVRKNEGILTKTEMINICMDFMSERFNEVNMRIIPFNRNKRRSPNIYKAEVSSEGITYFQKSCRKNIGAIGVTKFQCTSTLIFSSSGNIYLSGIELLGFQDSQVGYPEVSEFAANSEFNVSIKSIKSSSVACSAKVTSEQLEKSVAAASSVKIEFDNQISILRSHQYELTLTFNGGGDPSGRVRSRYGGQLTNCAKVICGKTNTTLSFVSEIIECGLQSVPGYTDYYGSCSTCLSSGQINAIYFSLN